MATFEDDLRLAHVLADAVERTTTSMFRSPDLQVRRKDDGTVVSDADVAAEEAIRHQLARTRPRDAVQGEEMPTTGHGNRRWIIDPIDGTSNYVRGVPIWATLIGLIVDDEAVLGMVAAPALNRRWWAARGTGAFAGRSLANAKPIQVSDVKSVADASLSYTSLDSFKGIDQRSAFTELCKDCSRTRAYGDFWQHMLVAEGAIDVAVDPVLDLHDMAALAPIVTEAGGSFSSIDGTPGPFGDSAVSTNGALHDVVVGRIDV